MNHVAAHGRISALHRCTIHGIRCVMILFQSCPPFYRNCWRTPVLNAPRTGSNSCLRATRRKCAHISPPVQGVFSRDTFTTLISRYFFSSFLSFSLFFYFIRFPCLSLSDFTRAPIDHLPRRNFTPCANHVCLTAFFALAKLFRAARYSLCTIT